LRVVVISENLRGVDILVEGAVEIDIDGDIRGKIELRVEGTSAVAALNACGSRKLPYVGSTSGWAVQALLDAVAFILDQRESQVDFSHNTRHVKALDISDAPAIANIQVAADALLRVVVIRSVAVIIAIITIITVSGNNGTSKSAGCKEGGREENCGNMHVDGGR